MVKPEQPAPRFYGSFGRFARWTFRVFSKPYRCAFERSETPCVYVCRHLNMHGPYTTLKWIPFDIHPFVLHVFTEKESAIKQYTEYTFAERIGKPAPKRSLPGTLAGILTCKVVRSLGAVPVYRDSRAIKTLREALKHLENGESLIVWPDVKYTEGYNQPCQIYSGFLYLGELYRRKTGKELPFIPLYLDDEARVIHAREPIVIQHFREEEKAVAAQMEQALQR